MMSWGGCATTQRDGSESFRQFTCDFDSSIYHHKPWQAASCHLKSMMCMCQLYQSIAASLNPHRMLHNSQWPWWPCGINLAFPLDISSLSQSPNPKGAPRQQRPILPQSVPQVPHCRFRNLRNFEIPQLVIHWWVWRITWTPKGQR